MYCLELRHICNRKHAYGCQSGAYLKQVIAGEVKEEIQNKMTLLLQIAVSIELR